VAGVNRGGTASPFFASRRRSDWIGRSIVSISTGQRASRARPISAAVKPRSRIRYSWNQNVPSTAARTSSMEQIDIVLNVNGTPAARAARAPWISPSRWKRPVRPVGAMPTGIVHGSPSTVVATDSLDTSTITRCRSCTCSRSAALRRNVSSSYAPRSA
jgi:hypothetical protein